MKTKNFKLKLFIVVCRSGLSSKPKATVKVFQVVVLEVFKVDLQNDVLSCFIKIIQK